MHPPRDPGIFWRSLRQVAVVGATRLIVLVVAGQFLTPMLRDPSGLIGGTVRSSNDERALGCRLLVAAVVLGKARRDRLAAR